MDFHLNLPVGFVSLFMINRSVHDPPYIKRREVALTCGNRLPRGRCWSLQIVLDTGQRNCISSHYIRFFATLCVCRLVSLVVRELSTRKRSLILRHSLIDPSLLVFTYRMLGFVLFSISYSCRSICKAARIHGLQRGIGTFAPRTRSLATTPSQGLDGRD